MNSYRKTPALLFLLLALVLCGCSTTGWKTRATEERGWDAAFERTGGWTGADVAGTIDLGRGRSLWLFGDTWIGAVESNRHTKASKLVANSIAIQEQGPTPGPIGFFWGNSNSTTHPAAWFAPDTTNTWFWPAGSGTVAPDAGGKPRLVVFLNEIGRRKGDTSVFGFKLVGGSLALIDHFDATPDRWAVRRVQNPHVLVSTSNRIDTTWGADVVTVTDYSVPGSGVLFIYGIRETSTTNKDLLVARCPAGSVDDFSSWRFYAGDGPWASDAAQAVSIADDLVNEFSVDLISWAGREQFVLIQSEGGFGRRISIRTADRPEGPWTEPVAVYTVDELSKSRNYFTYAARAHNELSGPNELLVSFVVNSTDFGEMIRQADIYRPRFIRVKSIR